MVARATFFITRKPGERNNMKRAPRAYITAHWTGNQHEDMANLEKYARALLLAGYTPVNSKLLYDAIVRKNNPEEYKAARDGAISDLLSCRQVVICGDTTDEIVKEDIAIAKHHKKDVTTLRGILEAEVFGSND